MVESEVRPHVGERFGHQLLGSMDNHDYGEQVDSNGVGVVGYHVGSTYEPCHGNE